MSNAGSFNQYVVFQRATKTNDFGEISDTWSELDMVKAEVVYGAGGETDQDGEVSRQAVTIKCRRGSEIWSVNTDDRVLVGMGYTATTSAVTATGVSLKVSSASEFPPAATPSGSAPTYHARMGTELVEVTAGQGTLTWTVTRGKDSSTATTHIASTAVTHMKVMDIISVLPTLRELEISAVVYGD